MKRVILAAALVMPAAAMAQMQPSGPAGSTPDMQQQQQQMPDQTMSPTPDSAGSVSANPGTMSGQPNRGATKHHHKSKSGSSDAGNAMGNTTSSGGSSTPR